MTPDAWPLVARLFDATADLGADDRAAFLDHEAPSPEVRAEVERLLALDEAAGAEGALPPLSPDPPPPTAGPWRLAARIGEGGMGEVWRAERADGAFEATAAVKLVRPGLAPDLVARFRAERHVLARLDHPGIARLIDGGVASDGRPYLALEYVDGEPITAYCDRERLDVAARLRLFGQVCEAVAYAHRALVVHRDLKPSNVLVCDTPHGPRVKLLDFGIAKLLDGDAAPFTVPVTAAERRVMTPEYAAPEQVRGEAVTTATDVYAIGVLLYELLTGSRPYRLTSRVRAAVERAILEEVPTEPSTAVGDETAAAARSTAPERLRRRLRGDLDQIVLTALRKEPERRYGSADALGRDLERHLDGLPVEARPESVRYRVGKFVRRHRAGVAVAVAGLVLVAAGVGAVILQSQRAAAERARAEAARDRAEAATGFLASVLESGLPAEARGDTLTVYEAIERSLATTDANLADAPLTRAAVRVAIGKVFSNTGQFARADSLLALADADVAAARRAGTPDQALEGRIAAARGSSLWAQTRFAEAEPFVRASVAEAEASGDPVLLAGRRSDLASLLYFLSDDPSEALALFRQSLDGYAETVGRTDPSALIVAANLGQIEYREGQTAAAERTLAGVLADLRRVHGPTPHPEVANTLVPYAMALDDLGRRAEAIAAARESLRQFRALHGPEHEMTAGSGILVAQLALFDGRVAEAERLACEAEQILRRVFAASPGPAVYPAAVCAAARLGRPAEALAQARAASAAARAHLGDDDPNRALAAMIEGLALAAAGQPAEGRVQAEAARADVEAAPARRAWARWAAARL